MGNLAAFGPSLYPTGYADVAMTALHLRCAGKALIRKDAIDKLDSTTLRRLGAAFIGSDELSRIDYQIYLRQQAGTGANAPEEVALQWIRDNNATYNMFSW